MNNIYGPKLFGFRLGSDFDSTLNNLKYIANKFDINIIDNNELLKIDKSADGIFAKLYINDESKICILCEIIYNNEDNSVVSYRIYQPLFDYVLDSYFIKKLLDVCGIEDSCFNYQNNKYENYKEGWELVIKKTDKYNTDFYVEINAIYKYNGPRFSI